MARTKQTARKIVVDGKSLFCCEVCGVKIEKPIACNCKDEEHSISHETTKYCIKHLDKVECDKHKGSQMLFYPGHRAPCALCEAKTCVSDCLRYDIFKITDLTISESIVLLNKKGNVRSVVCRLFHKNVPKGVIGEENITMNMDIKKSCALIICFV